MQIKAIAAMTESRVIGVNNSLPWHVPEDMKHFVTLTKGHTVLMGRKTFQSTPMKSKPLPNRLNVVVSRAANTMEPVSGVEFISDPIAFIKEVKSGARSLPSDTLWIIGGANIYEQTLPFWDEAYITIIKGSFAGDAYFPPFEHEFRLSSSEDIGPCTFQHYVSIRK